MSSFAISSIVFAFVAGGGLLGMVLHRILPKNHLSDDSKDVVRLGMGLVATTTALVLGLLVSSAKSSFDALSGEMTRASSKIILLDRTLALYGPETKDARDMLRSSVAGIVDRIEVTKSAKLIQMGASTREGTSFYEKIQGLMPKDERQRSIQARALGILVSLQESRWLVYEEESTAISVPMLLILLCWLTTLFISFGLFAPANATAVAALLVSAFSVSGAIFLILELYSPYGGLIKISSAPLRAALTQLGN
jgi:Protein of unknown function (DUF4239)